MVTARRMEKMGSRTKSSIKTRNQTTTVSIRSGLIVRKRTQGWKEIIAILSPKSRLWKVTKWHLDTRKQFLRQRSSIKRKHWPNPKRKLRTSKPYTMDLKWVNTQVPAHWVGPPYRKEDFLRIISRQLVLSVHHKFVCQSSFLHMLQMHIYAHSKARRSESVTLFPLFTHGFKKKKKKSDSWVELKFRILAPL